MNTKQLWNALCLNPVTNQYFDGIYSADTLKEIKEKPDLIICDTDPSNKPGECWVLFFFSDNSVDFFDSLGRDIKYYGSIFLDFIRWFKFTLKPPYTITHGNLLMVIWDTSHWTSFVKFGLKTA